MTVICEYCKKEINPAALLEKSWGPQPKYHEGCKAKVRTQQTLASRRRRKQREL